MKTNWNLNLIISPERLENIEGEKEIIQKSYQSFRDKWEKTDEYLVSATVLKEALDDYEKLNDDFGPDGDIGYYYWLKSSLDQNDPEVRAKVNQMHDFATNIVNEVEFFTNKLSKVAKEKQTEFLNSDFLSDYKHFLERLFESGKHTLSESEERIMNFKSKVSSYNWIKMLNGILNKEEAEVLNSEEKLELKNFNEIMELMSNKNKNVRDYAAKIVNSILEKHIDIAENELNSILENKKVDDNIRNYAEPVDARLLSDDISKEVVDSVMQVVVDNFSIPADYYKLKAKLFGVDKLEYHERNVEVGSIDRKYEYKEAYEIVSRVLKKLDPKYSELFDKYHENGQIDVYPTKGKSGGAFAAYNLKKQPNFILLNHNDTLNNVLTLAHEFGHTLNFELSKKQNTLNFSFPMSTAETSSTFFEDFVLEELKNDCTEEELLSLEMMKLNDEVSTIFRQIAAFNFEIELHSEFRKKGYLSSMEIGEIFTKHMESYMGESVEQSAGSQNWWVYWGHFRRPFYVYSYAFGLLVSKGLQSLVKSDAKNIEIMNEFLESGSVDSPKNILHKAGINIEEKSFWENGVAEIRKSLVDAEELAKKLGKI